MSRNESYRHEYRNRSKSRFSLMANVLEILSARIASRLLPVSGNRLSSYRELFIIARSFRTRYRLLIWRSSRCEHETALFSLRKTRRAILPPKEQIISVNVYHSFRVIGHPRGHELALRDSTWTRPRISGVLSNRQFARQTRQDKYHDDSIILLRGLSK